MNTRRQAAFIVARWILTKDYPGEMLPQGPDRAFVQDLVYTTIRRFRPLRETLGLLMKTWPKGELEALVLVGAAQILYMQDVPDFAAVNETVEAAKACSNKSIAKVVNGVLRNLLRRREEFEARIAASPLAARESFPNALVKQWIARFGEENAEKLCRFHNEPAETFLAWKPGANAEAYTKLPRATRVEDVPGYAEGAFTVQDPATRHAVELLAVEPGLKVLDYCAAPGGKTIQIAWRGAQVTAQEVNANRLRRLVKNLARCGLAEAVETTSAVAADALFPRVLVDAPCSNTGVLRRKPDARWNWSPEKTASLVKLQAEILDAAGAHVAPGGRLVYSTCSNDPAENAEQAAAFLARHAEFRAAGEAVESLPFETGEDGAYACAFTRV